MRKVQEMTSCRLPWHRRAKDSGVEVSSEGCGAQHYNFVRRSVRGLTNADELNSYHG
jgi:hypothetical protein